MHYSGPALPFYFAFVGFTIYKVIKFFLMKIMQRLNLIFVLVELEEGFKPYFSNLDPVDKKWTIKEELYNRDVFKYSTIPN
jgi:hypothetical protein